MEISAPFGSVFRIARFVRDFPSRANGFGREYSGAPERNDITAALGAGTRAYSARSKSFDMNRHAFYQFTIITAALMFGANIAPAQADTSGCTILLCLAAPFDPTRIPECVNPMKTLASLLTLGKKPQCPEAHLATSTPVYQPYTCPAGASLRPAHGGIPALCESLTTGGQPVFSEPTVNAQACRLDYSSTNGSQSFYFSPSLYEGPRNNSGNPCTGGAIPAPPNTYNPRGTTGGTNRQ